MPRKASRSRPADRWVQPGLTSWLAGGEPPGSPPYHEHDGRPVTWDLWEEVPTTSHIDWECESCGCRRSTAGPHERPWMTFGVVAPLEGETFRVVDEHRSRHERPVTDRRGRPRRDYLGRPVTERPWYGVERDVPAWPTIRLVAYWCGRCGECRIYDQRGGDDGREFVQVAVVPMLDFADE